MISQSSPGLISPDRIYLTTNYRTHWWCIRLREQPSNLPATGGAQVSVTLLSVLMVTLSCGRTLSTSRFHSAASTVDSRMSSGLEDGSASCQRTNNTTISFILERSRTQSYKPEGGSSRVPTRPSWQNLTLDVFKKLLDLWSYLRVFKCIIFPDELTLWVVRSFRASRSITFSSSSSASSWDHTHKTCGGTLQMLRDSNDCFNSI